MTEKELLQLIETVEQEELHRAPDYLKDIILRKANPVPKQSQLIIYSLKTLAATAAALMILFTIPQSTFVPENIRLQEIIQLQEKGETIQLQEKEGLILEAIQSQRKEKLIQETMHLQKKEKQIQEQIKKEREQINKKILKDRERTYITDYLNRGSSYICNQILTIFDTKN